MAELEEQLADEKAAKDDLNKKMQKYVDKIADLEDQLAEVKPALNLGYTGVGVGGGPPKLLRTHIRISTRMHQHTCKRPADIMLSWSVLGALMCQHSASQWL